MPRNASHAARRRASRISPALRALALAALAALAGVPLAGARPAAAAGSAGALDNRSAALQVNVGACNTGTTCDRQRKDAPIDDHAWQDQLSARVSGVIEATAHSVMQLTETFATTGDVTSIDIGIATEVIEQGTSATDDGAVGRYRASFATPAATVTVSGTISAEATASGATSSIGNVIVSLQCGGDLLEVMASGEAGGARASTAADSRPVGGSVDVRGTCELNVQAGSTTGRSQDLPGTGTARGSVTLRLAMDIPAGCPGLGGTITDGSKDRDGHDLPLPGIQLELLKGGTPAGRPVVSGPTGIFCFLGRTFPADDYTLRASLVDGVHVKPWLETRHQGDSTPVAVELSVKASDFNAGKAFNVAFSTADRPWVADAAAIHRESARFLAWAVATFRLDESLLEARPIVIRTERDVAGWAAFDRTAAEIAISPEASTWAFRDNAIDPGPGVEWHELGHYLAVVTGLDAGCTGDIAHGGWTNPTSCDSLAEGIAAFLALEAGIDLNRGRGDGYGTTFNPLFGDLEANAWRPWSAKRSPGGLVQREDAAVAQLLLDLADDTPEEGFRIAVQRAGEPADAVTVRDEVALGVPTLARLLFSTRPRTVTDLYGALVASSGVTGTLKDPVFNVSTRAGAPDTSRLAAVFLGSGFHPVVDAAAPETYRPGEPVGRTDHAPASGATAIRERPAAPAVAGAAIRLRNQGVASATVTITVQTGNGSGISFPMALAAGTDRVVHLELPPYWTDLLAADGPLPDCDTATGLRTTVTIAAGGKSAKADACAYEQAVAGAVNGAALTFDTTSGTLTAAAAQPAGPVNPATGWIVLAIQSALLIVVLVISAVVLAVIKRRREAQKRLRDIWG